LPEAEAEAGKMPRVPTEEEVTATADIPNRWTIDRLAATVLG
jgi:hypothetical protein